MHFIFEMARVYKPKFDAAPLTLIGMSYQSKKNAHIYRNIGVFFLRLNEPIDVNFYIPKSLEFFVKNSADKIWSKKDKEWRVSPLMLYLKEVLTNRSIWSSCCFEQFFELPFCASDLMDSNVNSTTPTINYHVSSTFENMK